MADKVLQHLNHVAEFLRTQRSLVDDDTYQSMVQAHFDTSKITLESAGRIDPASAAQISSAFGQGPWSDRLKKEFAVALSNSVSSAVSSPKGKRPSQECAHFRAFLSQSDRAVLADPALSEQEKLDQVAVRCVKIGLILPTETTNGAIILASVAAGLSSRSPEEFYNILGTWKRKLKAKREKLPKNEPVQLTVYPDSVNHLPENLQISYKADPPEPVTVEQIMQINNIETLRKNSSKLAGKNKGVLAIGATSSTSTGFNNMDPMMMMGTMLQQCLQMMQGNMGAGSNSAASSQAGSIPGLHIFTPSSGKQAKQPAQQLPLPNQPDAAAAPSSGSQLALPAPTGTPAAGVPPPNPAPANTTEHKDTTQPVDAPLDIDDQLAWMQGVGGKGPVDKNITMKKPHAAPGNIKPKPKVVAKAKAKVKSQAKAKVQSQPKAKAKSACNKVVKTINKKSGWKIEFRRRSTDQSLYGKWISPTGDIFKSSNLAEVAGFDPNAP
eukprot:s2541_g3.t1